MRKYHQSDDDLVRPIKTCLLAWASYEDRCLSAAALLSAKGDCSGIILHFDEKDYDITSNLKKLIAVFGNKLLEKIQMKRSVLFDMYSTLRKSVEAACKCERVIVDITCFPRDILLILQFVIFQIKVEERVEFIYNVASDYSVGESDDRKWLSRGVRDISPILGFRGKLVPGRPTFVLGLLGLDRDRFLQTVTALEPSDIAIGIGQSSSQEKGWLYKKNSALASELSSAFCVSNVFSFDCDSTAITIAKCAAFLYQGTKINRTVIPMNNKPSTLAVGAMALCDRSIQVCYSRPLIYNMAGYSTPSDIFYLGLASDIIAQAVKAFDLSTKPTDVVNQ